MAARARQQLARAAARDLGEQVKEGRLTAALSSFGSLLAGTIGVALVADFLLMPALVLTFKPYGPEDKLLEGVESGSIT